jgi:hypothetical protein
VTDIVWLVAWINGRKPAGFQQAATDIDGNGLWNVVDVVKLVDIINAVTPPSQMPASRTAANNLQMYDAQAATVSNHVYLRQSETNSTALDLCLDNIDEVQAFQVDLILTPGLLLETAAASLIPERSDGHVLSLKCLSETENRYRLLVWSLRTDNALKGNAGAVVRLKMHRHSTNEGDTLTGSLEQSVLTGMDMKAVSSRTYDTRLSLAGEVVETVAGSDGNGSLWVRGHNLKEIEVYDLTGKKVAEASGVANGLVRIRVCPGFYLVRASHEILPSAVMKVIVP